jgi:hypothetical protein
MVLYLRSDKGLKTMLRYHFVPPKGCRRLGMHSRANEHGYAWSHKGALNRRRNRWVYQSLLTYYETLLRMFCSSFCVAFVQVAFGAQKTFPSRVVLVFHVIVRLAGLGTHTV